MIRKIMHRPQAVLGLAMMLLVFLVMLLAPVFAPNDPMQLNVAHSFAPPDAQYPLGKMCIRDRRYVHTLVSFFNSGWQTVLGI